MPGWLIVYLIYISKPCLNNPEQVLFKIKTVWYSQFNYGTHFYMNVDTEEDNHVILLDLYMIWYGFYISGYYFLYYDRKKKYYGQKKTIVEHNFPNKYSYSFKYNKC